MDTNDLWIVKVPTMFKDYGKPIYSVELYIVKALTHERAVDMAVLACGNDSMRAGVTCMPFNAAYEKRLSQDGAVLITSI